MTRELKAFNPKTFEEGPYVVAEGLPMTRELKVNSHLATRNPPLVTYDALLRKRSLISEVMNILPASMQYQQVKITHEYTELPDDLKQKVRFIARNPQPATGEDLFDIVLDLAQLSNQKVAVSYEPETVEDQQIINGYGGLGNTPAYLVRLRPVLKVNGERMAVGKDGLPMGADYQLTVELRGEGAELTGSEKITNTMIVGNLSVIGIVSQNAINVASGFTPDDKDAEQILYEEAMNYIDRWNKGEEELSSLFHLAVARPIPTVVTLGSVIDVTYLLDMPHGFEWKGVFVDADLKTIETVASRQNAGGREKEFMKISGLQGSILENRIFEEGFQVESISTAKLFTLTRSTKPPTQILTIDKSNIASILPTLPFDENIKEDITNSVNQNLTIRIPQSEIIYEDWTGIGYIKENPGTGESGYMLSGMIAGGMTAWGVDKWPEYYKDKLENPDSEPPTEDPASATSIQKIVKTDLQKGKVGQPLQSPLQVIVRDKKNKPVKNVEVTFTIKAGGGKFAGGSTTSKVKTGSDGIASILLTLGQKTSANPTFMWEEGPTEDKPYAQQVGENIVEASLPSGTKIPKPFTAYGFPGDAAQIRKLAGDGKTGTILNFAGFVSVVVEDEYQNPISNLPVSFSVLPTASEKPAVLVKRDDPCLKNAPFWGECSSQSSSLEEKTSSKGALAHVVLGDKPGIEYPIRATTGSFSTTFSLRSSGISIWQQFFVTYVYNADVYGNRIEAGKVGKEIPVQARIYEIKEGEYEQSVTQTCYVSDGEGGYIEVPLTCTLIFGDGKYSIHTDLQSPSVTFEGRQGIFRGNGIYTSTYILKPGRNVIPIHGEARAEYMVKGMICPSTCTTDVVSRTMSDDVTMIVYGVDIQLDPTPVIVVDDQGYATNDYTITYTIAPAAYKALSAFVFIYKNDQLIAQIPTEITGTGTATIARGFWFDVNSTYEAEVVLNLGTGVEIRSDKQEIKFGDIYIEKEDPEYLDVKLRWDDYYPALGGKVITIKTSKESLNDAVVKYAYQGNTANELSAINPDLINPNSPNRLIIPIDEKITDKRMRFRITGPMLAPKVESDPSIKGIDEINLKFYIEGNENAETQATYRVKNNFNTTLGEVLAGEAVFVYDNSGEKNHIGKTEANVAVDNDKKLDFVQELLNQVVPRKRSVGQNYQLLESSGINSGIYNDLAMEAVRLFRTNFGFASPSRTFAKLKKDYSNPITNEAVWLNKIIEKDILVGKTFSPQDQLINGETGLYELYKNVVERFIASMMNEANRYAGNEPTDNWVARTGEGPAGSTNPHGPGMSYCYGCKDSISDFNGSVANCRAEPTDCIKCREAALRNTERCQRLREPGGLCENVPASPEYRGDLDPSCTVGNGTANWAGLYKDELNYNINQPFHHSYWAGIDCSGLVTRSGERARSSLGAAVNLLDLYRNSCTFFFTKSVCDAHVSAGGPPLYITDQPSGFNYNFGVNDGRNTSPTSKIRRGDLVSYDGHISIVYSERPNCSGTMCNYQIIHAYGWTPYRFPENPNVDVFSRKVLITRENIRANLIGFGRIKLWE